MYGGWRTVLLRTGVVLGGGYALKVNRVFFAQVKEAVKRGELKKEEAKRAVSELNRTLYNILVEELKVEKEDVVRISIEYEIRDGTVHWNMNSLTVEVWPRCPPLKVYRPAERPKEERAEAEKEERGEVLISEQEKVEGAEGGPA
ncbi:MAG: DUF2258 domain-containing protein [Acidilobaceae archaeon]